MTGSKRDILTLVELAVVIAIIVVLVLVLLPMSPWWSGAKIASCQGNLKQWASIYRIYADEAPGNRLPPKSPFAAAPDVAVLYPDLVYDFEPLVCTEAEGSEDVDQRWYDPEGDPRIDVIRREGDAFYTYLGFAIPNNAWIDPPDEVQPLLRQALANVDTDAEWTEHPNRNVYDVTLYRLHQDVARVLAEEGHMRAGDEHLAIMWDNVWTPQDPSRIPPGMGPSILMFNHLPGASNVLFLDGHVEFVEYPGSFPVTGECAHVNFGEIRSDEPDAQP